MGCHFGGGASWLSTPLLSLLSHGKGSPDGGTGGMRGLLGCPPQQGASLPRTRCQWPLPFSGFGLRNWRSLGPRNVHLSLRLLASHRARQAPQILQQAVSTALLHRWSAMLTHAAATAYAASRQGCDGASEANVEGTPPSFSELLAQTPPEHPPASRLPPPAT